MNPRIKSRFFSALSLLVAAFLLSGCSGSKVIVSDLEEREANIIVVFLESKGIPAQKQTVTQSASAAATGGSHAPKFNIAVAEDRAIDAMAILNSNGLPHQKKTNLLDLFAKSGLMSTDKEETIRYQAGLASQITNMILMIDGVIDADIQVSFPESDAALEESAKAKKVTAAVFVKHQGVVDDPNSHLINKIKRLVAGSVHGLHPDDVTVISDRSRFTDITPNVVDEQLMARAKDQVQVWSINMQQSSVGRFRLIFFMLLVFLLLLVVVLGWLSWKFYPLLKFDNNWRKLLHPLPFFKAPKPKKQQDDEEAVE